MNLKFMAYQGASEKRMIFFKTIWQIRAETRSVTACLAGMYHNGFIPSSERKGAGQETVSPDGFNAKILRGFL